METTPWIRASRTTLSLMMAARRNDELATVATLMDQWLRADNAAMDADLDRSHRVIEEKDTTIAELRAAIVRGTWDRDAMDEELFRLEQLLIQQAEEIRRLTDVNRRLGGVLSLVSPEHLPPGILFEQTTVADEDLETDSEMESEVIDLTYLEEDL